MFSCFPGVKNTICRFPCFLFFLTIASDCWIRIHARNERVGRGGESELGARKGNELDEGERMGYGKGVNDVL